MLCHYKVQQFETKEKPKNMLQLQQFQNEQSDKTWIIRGQF
jgi:hypothetical protein